MLSAPPANTIPASPLIMAWVALTTAWRAEPHCRSTEKPGTLSSKPATSADTRARLGVLLSTSPIMTCSTSFFSMPPRLTASSKTRLPS